MSHDIFNIIAHRKENDLLKALEDGWYPEEIELKYAGWLEQTSVWIDIIAKDWVEGLILLDKFHPEYTTKKLWKIAISGCNEKCIAFLWDRLGFSKDNFDYEERILVIRAIMNCMGSFTSEKYEIKEVIPTINFFKSKGMSLEEVIPSEFEENDFRVGGHSIFTRATLMQKWEVIDEIWPESIESIPQKRLTQGINLIINMITGEHKSLIHDEFENQKRLNFISKWIKDFGYEWLTQLDNNTPLFEILSKPTKIDIAPILRLPLFMSDRKLIWDLWFKILSSDPKKTWLHELAMYPVDTNVQQIINLAKIDKAKCFIDFWDDKNNGFSAHDKWVALNGDINLIDNSWIKN